MAFTVDATAFYTPAEVAEKLGISRRTLDNWRWAGKGPAPTRSGKGGGRVWYSGAAVRAYLEQRTARWPTATA